MNGYKRDGVSEAGAPMYKGKWKKPPLGVALRRILMVFMILVLFKMSVSDWHKPVRHVLFSPFVHRSMRVVPNFIWMAFCISNGLSGFWMLKTRYRLRHLQTTDQICTQFGMGDDVFHAWREQQTIKPHININGTDYYRPADFVDAGTLLRASAQPVTPEILLRPAVSIETTPTEQLLRATDTP